MKRRISYFKQKGDPYIFATSLALAISIGMVVLIVVIILVNGLGFFWPSDLYLVEQKDGKKFLGERWAEDVNYTRDAAGREIQEKQIQLKIGNRDVYGRDFVWLKLDQVKQIQLANQAVVLERLEYGNFYGFMTALRTPQGTYSLKEEPSLKQVVLAHNQAMQLRKRRLQLESRMNKLMTPLARVQRELSRLQTEQEAATPRGQKRLEALREKAARMEEAIAPSYQQLLAELEEVVTTLQKFALKMRTAEGMEKEIPLEKVVRIYQPNTMMLWEKCVHYGDKLLEFLLDEPRESNTEGGVFPAIFGTVMMVLLMTIAVVPLGVLAAIYLNEYARQGTVIRLIRLSVNNLAGVPSIVFGIFGLGFFIYMIGGTIDQLFFSDRLPTPTYGTGGILWASLTLALLTLPVVVVATEEGILAVPRANKEGALALGATRWQMVRKIVLPNAMPGILTGVILAISRGAGEVAPLMITGVVKLAPSLPVDGNFPFLHLDRKFMHLGFHIYDVGFQSPNVEAAKPMVYMTALLLMVLVIALNVMAIAVRNRLRKKFRSAAF